MRITALVKSSDHVCCRYRIAAYRPLLEQLGCAVDIRPWSSRWFFQQIFPVFADVASILIVQRKLFPRWQLRILRRRARWLIYDFDDSIFLRSSYNPRGHDCPKRFERFRDMVQAADVVIAGNEFLCDQATAIGNVNKVHLIPTCVDASGYPLARHDADRPHVKLAWIGSSSTIRGLEMVRDLLEHIGQTVPGMMLKVICDRSLRMDHLPIEFRPWQLATETSELADADIGMSWLPDDVWSAGKCGLKVLQYMAAGLPVIANPVGVQCEQVRHGETGFLVTTPDEWIDAVRLLAADPDLRRRMGHAGRRLVEEQYPVTRGIESWCRVLRSLCHDKSIAEPITA
ncbi:MAG TPA: glycosyltransferase family 4 protein [Gemmataceae bacterium]|nr:glycosyltransferase family 4 protein [Gemmataceae bacterium]